MQPATPRTRRWTVTEYERLAELGFLDGPRAELIDGRIVEMPAMRNEHAVALALTEEALGGVFAAGFWVRTQMPLRLGKHSAPEPGLAVVPGQPRDYLAHPTTALLVVEVSDTTLGFDRGRKARLYAAAGIEEYWIVNLVERRLEVRRGPRAPARRPRRAEYRLTTFHEPGESASPLAAPDRTMNVSDLLP